MKKINKLKIHRAEQVRAFVVVVEHTSSELSIVSHLRMYSRSSGPRWLVKLEKSSPHPKESSLPPSTARCVSAHLMDAKHRPHTAAFLKPQKPSNAKLTIAILLSKSTLTTTTPHRTTQNETHFCKGTQLRIHGNMNAVAN
jgi:hypothetical protein